MTVAPRHVGPLLEVKGIKTHFFTQDGAVKAIRAGGPSIQYVEGCA